MIHKIERWLDDDFPDKAVFEKVPHHSEPDSEQKLFTEVILFGVAPNGQSIPLKTKRVPIEAETIQDAFSQIAKIEKDEEPKMIREFEGEQRRAALNASVNDVGIMNGKNAMKFPPRRM